MNRLNFAVGLIAIAACFGLQAQSVDLRANIPFDFRVGDTLMPAGDYQLNYKGNVLMVREQGGSLAAVMTVPFHTTRRGAPKAGSLVFSGYGESYFFTKLWAPRSQEGLQLRRSSLEVRIAGRPGQAPQKPIVIATN